MTIQFPAIDFSQRRVSDYISKQETMGRLATSYNLRVPHYQRNYSWDASSVQDFMDSVCQIVDTNAIGGMHMLSHMTFHKRHNQGQAIFDIIDGQQRITTFFLLLATILRELQKTPELNTTKGGMFQGNLLNALFVNFDPDAPASAARLRLQHALRDEAEVFRGVCLPHVKLSDLDSKNTMVRACEALTKAMRAHCGRFQGRDLAPRSVIPFDYLRMIYGVAMSGLEVMVTETDRDDQVNRLFEDMNSKGMPLSQSDLVRNHFAQYLDDDTFIEGWGRFENARLKAQEKCDAFLAMWILAHYGVATTQKKVHKTFCGLIAQKRILPDAAILSSMACDAERISAYKRGQDMHGTSLDGLAWLLESRSVRQHLPLLLAAEKIEQRAPAVFARLCEEVARTVMCMTISGVGNHKIEHAWENWAKTIHVVETDAELDAFLNAEGGMREKRADVRGDLEAVLAKSGEDTKWANNRPKHNQPQYVALAYLGHALEKATGSTQTARAFLHQVTLEHIIPAKAAYAMEAPTDQEGFRATVTALGNLSLLTSNENSTASNRPLAEKRGCYAASGVALSRALIHPLAMATSRARAADLLLSLPTLGESFGPKDVDERTKRMGATITDLLVG